MSTKITSPIEGYDGPSTFAMTRLVFVQGVAVTEEELPEGLLAYLASRGYTVEKTDEDVELPAGLPDESWSHKQLDTFATDRGLSVAKSLSKVEKVAALLGIDEKPADVDADADEKPADADEKPTDADLIGDDKQQED